MAVKIRLRRTGRKKQASYRIVVAEESTPRDGQYLDALGTYNPQAKPADLRIDMAKVEAWIARGAGMTDTAASLIKKARKGGDKKVAVRAVEPEMKPEAPAVAAAAEPSKPRAGSRGAPKAETAVAEPAAPTEEPVAAAPESDAAVAEPAAPTEEPVAAAPESDAAVEEPVAAVEAPVASVEEPADETTPETTERAE